MIVIACNTASSVAYETIKNECPKIEIVNVIDPIVKRITTSIDTNIIGVIGTKRTINSDVYPQKIKSINQNISVKSYLSRQYLSQILITMDFSTSEYLSDKRSPTLIR